MTIGGLYHDGNRGPRAERNREALLGRLSRVIRGFYGNGNRRPWAERNREALLEWLNHHPEVAGQ